MIEKPAGPGIIVFCKNGRRTQHDAPEATQQFSAPLDSRQRIGGAGHETADKGSGCESFKLYRIDAEAVAQSRGKQPVAEHHKAGERQALRATDVATCGGVAKAPRRTGAGVEQYADD